MIKTKPYKNKILLLWLFLLPLLFFSQNAGTSISWNSQVGCQEYNSQENEDPKQGIRLLEEIDMGNCIRVCEGSQVTYTLASSNFTITSVIWGVAGGIISSTTTNPHSATIDWGNTGAGSVNFTINYSNGTQETKSICIEKIDGPIAQFAIAAGGGRDVCQNTPMYFDNQSLPGGGTGIVSYEWDFADGSPTTSVFEPVHTFSAPGVYTVRLKVTNQCNCSSYYEMDINVLQANPIEISCPGVVCFGSKQTYTANNTCDGEWDVIGGTPLNINGNTIEIAWDQVDPADGFGYVKYRSKCGCPAWNTIKIPVVVPNGIIQGPTNVCIQKQYKYELPRWPTTDFQWDVSGPAPVQSTYNSQRNEVFLKFSAPGTYTLRSYYENTLLKCGGKSEPITIIVTEPLSITGGQPEVCTGNSLTFNSNGSGNVIWQVSLNGAVIDTQNTSGSFQYLFPNPGTYIVTATDANGGCTGEGYVVKALAIPPAPTGNITGDQIVCAGIPYTYTITPPNAGFLPVWSVVGGTIQGSNTGNSVNIVFNASATSYVVSVQNRTIGSLGCLSAPISYAVQKVDFNTITVSNSAGTNVFCPSSSATFTANFNGIVPDDFNWSFDAQHQNFGSLLVDPTNPNAVIVNFNEISGGSTANLILTVTKCGQNFPINIPVVLQTLPVISVNGGTICEGNPTFSVSVNLPLTVNSGTLTFTFPNTDTEQVTVASGGGTQTFVIDNHFVNSTNSVVSQSLQVQLTSPNGCNYVATAAVNFDIIPELDVTITPGYFYSICPTSTYNEQLSGSIPSGNNNVSYQWFKNGLPITPLGNYPTYLINNTNQPSPGGSYYLVVTTNSNGCKSQSQNIIVSEGCGSFPPCTINPNPNLNVTATWIDCNTIAAAATFTGNPNTFEWSSSPFLQLQSGSTSTSATFTVVEAGVHSINLSLDYNGCTAQNQVDITKNYKPDFKAKISCNSNGTYNVTLTDTSLLSDITSSSINYSYTMNGGNAQNGQIVTYSGLQPGTSYNFSIKLDGPGTMPDCIYSELVTMPNLPNTQFSVSQTTVCKGEKIILSIPQANFLPNHIYKWLFAGTAYIANNANTDITFNTASPNHEVQLEVTTPNGCVFLSAIVTIVVNESKFLSVNLSGFSTDVCETSPNQPLLIVTTTGSSALNYEWMNGNQSVTTTLIPSYQPITSGSYWVIVRDATNGCLDKTSAADPVSVNIRSAPQVSIVGSSQVCQNNTITLQGVVTDNNLQYELMQSFNGGGNSTIQTGNSATPITYTSAPLTVGTYVYTLNVWSASDPTCLGSSSFTVTVSSPPAAPNAIFTVINCLPYTVKLSVSNPGAGTYNWSNGQSGSEIFVNTGGLYQVNYTAPSGCTSTQQIMVPHSLEDLMWIFPTGCYDICRGDGFIIGPRGTYDNYEWQYFGNPQQSGNGFINPFWPSTPGTYNLHLENGGCEITSGNMNVSPSPNNPNCAPRDCKLDFALQSVKKEGSNYLIFGTIMNFSNQAVTVNLTSANNYGVYYPSSIMIGPGQSYNMNPVIFYPDPNTFPGGVDILTITGPIPGCVIKAEVVMDDLIYSKTAPASIKTESVLKMIPNPAHDDVRITYDTGSDKVEALGIYIYDQSGNIRHQEKLSKSKGEVKLNVSRWLQGMYLVNITTSGKPMQGKLLKE